jgi:plastocyanin
MSTRHTKEGYGFEKFSDEGEVTIEHGSVLIRRVSGGEEVVKAPATVKVHAGDEIYWTQHCIYIQQGG